MKKNAQLTLIIAIAIFISIIAALIFYVANYFDIKNPIAPLAFEKTAIENYVKECIKKTAEDGLRLLGKQGGFIYLKGRQKEESLSIAYMLSSNKNNVPKIEEMQNELSLYVNSNLGACLDDFEDFKRQGWNVKMAGIRAGTSINENDVVFNVDFPLEIGYKGNVISFERFIVQLNVRLKYIHELVRKVAEFSGEHPRSVDRTALSNYDVEITVFPYEGSLVYSIKDKKSPIMNQPYSFNFAMRFG